VTRATKNLSPAFRYLVALAVVLLAGIALEMLWPHPLDVPTPGVSVAAGASGESAATPDGMALRTAAEYAEIGARPLFSADRKPYQPPLQAAVAELAAAPAMDFSLSGIVTTATARMALIRVGDSGPLVKLAVGESHEGWLLVAADGKTATLRNGDSSVEIHLNEPQ
jgi:hypothetical protein